MNMELLNEKITACPILEGTLAAYLEASFAAETNPSTLCKGWKFLKENLTPFLKECLTAPEYWALEYNAQKEALILSKTGESLTEALKSQLGAFVYCWNVIKRDCDKEQARRGIIALGFTEINGTEQELNGALVVGYFNIPKMGIMGSFRALEKTEGRLAWNGRLKALMLVPRGRRTRGYLIQGGAFIVRLDGKKEEKKED